MTGRPAAFEPNRVGVDTAQRSRRVYFPRRALVWHSVSLFATNRAAILCPSFIAALLLALHVASTARQRVHHAVAQAQGNNAATGAKHRCACPTVPHLLLDPAAPACNSSTARRIQLFSLALLTPTLEDSSFVVVVGSAQLIYALVMGSYASYHYVEHLQAVEHLLDSVLFLVTSRREPLQTLFSLVLTPFRPVLVALALFWSGL